MNARAGTAAATRIEDAVAGVVLLAMVVLPVGEIVARWFGTVFVPGAITLVQHLTLWVAFLGAAIAARQGKLLALATATFLPERVQRASGAGASLVAAAIGALLTWGAVELVLQSYRFPTGAVGPDIPRWIAQLGLPIGMALVTLRLVWHGGRTWAGRSIAAIGLAAAAASIGSSCLLPVALACSSPSKNASMRFRICASEKYRGSSRSDSMYSVGMPRVRVR